jgi:hypothetical protein
MIQTNEERKPRMSTAPRPNSADARKAAAAIRSEDKCAMPLSTAQCDSRSRRPDDGEPEPDFVAVLEGLTGFTV